MFLRPAASAGPRPAPVGASLLAHAWRSLYWVVFVPHSAPPKKPLTAYQREIAPNEKKLVWYRFNTKLPEVTPAKVAKIEAPRRKRPAPVKATVQHPKQTIVAKSERPDAGKQLMIAPGPELKTQHELDAPNLMAFKMPEPPAPPEPPKPFTPPAEPTPAAEPPKLENGPEIASRIVAPPTEIPVAKPDRPEPKAFNPPPPAPKQAETPQLQPGEAIVAAAIPDAAELAAVPRPAKPAPKRFDPPKQIAKVVETPVLQPGQVAVTSNGVVPAGDSKALSSVGRPDRPAPRVFYPPQAPAHSGGSAPTLSAGPTLVSQAPKAAGIPGDFARPDRPAPKLFTPPSRTAGTAGGAGASEGTSPVIDIPPTLASNLNVAVVGLNPVDRVPVVPEGSRPAQFSAAPEISPKGGEPEPGNSSGIVLKDLTITDNSGKIDKPVERQSLTRLTRVEPTSHENLLATARPTPSRASPIGALPLPAVRVPAAPDPRLDGRVVYTIAIQMPNVTSYSGSWILWFAERKSESGEAEIAAPEPLRKVDPIYDNSAVDDRVEGKVQLAAIIHTDGYVYGINVVHGLDPRLDKSATEALRKWEFTPARRDGRPVDVDIVIEIPFRLRTLK